MDVSEWSATQLRAGCGAGTWLDGLLDWKARARSFSAMGIAVRIDPLDALRAE